MGSTAHKIEEIFKFPIIAKEEKKGIYKVRLHDGRVSEMYDDCLEVDSYIEYQKRLIETFIRSILLFEDWKIENISYDSMNLCEIIIPALTTDFELPRRKLCTPKEDKKPFGFGEKKLKFTPVELFPFNSRASLCKHFDNMIATSMISDEDELGPRKWIVKFHNKNILVHLSSLYGKRPSFDEITKFKMAKKAEVIEKITLSCETAKWKLFETFETDCIIGFYQF
jgi:hypothetical protein